MSPFASSGTLICNSCEVEAVPLSDESGLPIVQCPACGEFGDHAEVLQLAGQHLMRGPVDELRNRLARSTSGLKNVKYIRGSQPSLPTPKFVFREDAEEQ